MMSSKNMIGKIIVALAAILLLGYIIFRTMPLVLGPHIDIVTPEENQLIVRDSIDIMVSTKRAVKMFIAGDEVPIDISGTTSYRYYLSEGLQNIEIEVFDIYDKSKKKTRSVIKK